MSIPPPYSQPPPSTAAPTAAPTRALRRPVSALSIGFAVPSIVITGFGVLLVWGWTAFSSMEGNSSAGWALLAIVPLAWIGTLLGLILAVVALIVAIVKRASVVIGAVALAISVIAIILGVAFGYFAFILTFFQ